MSNARELAELGGAYSTGGYPHFKNRIINGQMMIDQRYGGGEVTAGAGATYTADRFKVNCSQASKLKVQRIAGGPAGYKFALKVTSLSSYPVGASEVFLLQQNIEGYNIADFGFGASGASSITLSFWVKSSLTGTFGGVLLNNAENRAYPFTYTITTPNTYEQKTITVAGDATGTWLYENGVGIQVVWGLGVGSSLSGTANAWSGAGSIYGVTGAVSVVGTNAATWEVTGVQLEKGSTATSFDYRPYGTELALCQRYFEKGTYATIQQTTNGYGVGSTQNFSVAKRATPTMSYTNFAAVNVGTTAADWNTTTANLGVYHVATASGNAQYGDNWTASAEL